MLMLRCQCIHSQMAFKMCHIKNHNNVSQKLKKMTDIRQIKVEWDKKHLNKQMAQVYSC